MFEIVINKLMPRIVESLQTRVVTTGYQIGCDTRVKVFAVMGTHSKPSDILWEDCCAGAVLAIYGLLSAEWP